MEVDNEKVPVNTALLFQKIAASLVNEKESMKDAIAYELSPYPMALFNDSGIMQEKNRHEFSVIQAPEDADRMIITTACDIAKETSKRVVVVGTDVDLAVLLIALTPEERTIDMLKPKILKQPEQTASALRNLLSETPARCRPPARAPSLARASPRLPSPLPLPHLCLKNRHEFSVIQAPEDADRMIITTACDIAKETSKRVVVVGTDVDLAVLLIALTPEERTIDMLKPKILKQPEQVISSRGNIMFKKFILFAHAFSGCDTVSSVFQKGKGRLLQLLEDDLEAQKLAEIFYKKDSLLKDIEKAGEKIMLKLYKSQHSSLNKCRVDRFSVVATKSSAFNLALLPPTSGATYQHSLRTFLQVQLWLGNNLNPETYGWKKTETMFLPVRTQALFGF
ncbi:hypothetical protein EVAR_87201_1 [Eumeta japonica]|uniref:Uncharacterized protein n=1 Tax=Eumeta variegata TaxID=151549 RepID=A0A4C1VVS0_EUMVA|nr:hypothetical protein EVAR_87201_1 [Eumeta japonica]